MNFTKSLVLTAVIVTGLCVVASADVLKVVPTQAVVLPADESGQTKIAIAFDFSAMRSGEGRRIDEALLDWKVTDVPSDQHSEFSAQEATAAWTSSGVAQGSSVSVKVEEAASWTYEALDYERNAGGLIRLDLTDLVRAWTSGEAANHGLVIATSDMDAADFADQLAKVELTIRYGFIK